MNISEFDTRPKRILMHHPRHGSAINSLSRERLADVNFLDLPDVSAFHQEYDRFALALREYVEPIFLDELLAGEPAYLEDAAKNPNLIFTRDSSITLPWAPDLYIPARLALASRRGEVGIVGLAMRKLGLAPMIGFSDDEYIEGGDVLPAMDEGKRILIIGFGVRTTKAAALKLAIKLIPEHLDQIIGLSHDPDLLHLDTGFTILPNRVMFAAAGMFHSGFLIDENRSIHDIDPIARAERLGFKIIRCEKAQAIAHERCNVLPLGDGRYIAFEMPAATRHELEEASGVSITSITGAELAKAAGGVHCLTRPIYR
jgi:N-dimethylarginine dimethylaminohydrolase